MANVIPSLMQGYQYGMESLNRGLGSIADALRDSKMRDTGRKFIEMGDYSPEGIQTFAKENKVSPQEMAGIVQMASAFEQYKKARDPLVQVETSDAGGNTFVQSVPQSQTIGQRFQTGVAEKVAYLNPETKETRLYPKGRQPDPGFYPISTANALLNKRAQKENIEYQEGQRNERARLSRETGNEQTGSSGGSKDKGETVNQKIAKANFLAQSLGYREDGFDQEGNPLPDKMTFYQGILANGSKDQQSRARKAIELEYDIAGLKAPSSEPVGKPVGTLNTEGINMKNVNIGGATITAIQAPDGKYYYKEGGKTYLVDDGE